MTSRHDRDDTDDHALRQHRSHPGLGGGGAGPVYPSTRRHQDRHRLPAMVRLPEPARPSIDLTLATNDRRWQSPAVTTIGSALVAVGARWEAGVPD